MVGEFEEAGLVAHIRGPLKQAFGVHPTDASETGLPHRKYEYLKRYVQGVNCVAVGYRIRSRPGEAGQRL